MGFLNKYSKSLTKREEKAILMTTSDDDSLNRLKETKTEYGSVTTTCSLKQTTAYNDSQTETGEGQYASGLVKTLTVRDGKKADSQPALSVYTLEYDAEGNAVKVTHGKPHKNALGDIDAIYDTDMNLVGEYVYDAWGNCTIEAAGTDNLAIMQLNPFRYRGYYWDKELNLYYLQTRYYDPETGRFINADCITYSAPIIVNGLNLYSYCANNPILRFDPNGNSFWKNVGKVIGGALLLLAGAATALLTLPIAVSVPGCGFLTQVGFSTASYGGLMIGSVFDSQIQADMDEIGWNPFNKNENAVLNSTKVSFYKGIPIFRKEAGFRSGSFLCILLARGDDVNDLRHEWGHTIQQGILGAVRYGLMIGIPSWQSWGKKDYYDKPWEVTADYFGGVEGRSHKDHDISAGINYLAAVAIWGILGTLFLIGEY